MALPPAARPSASTCPPAGGLEELAERPPIRKQGVEPLLSSCADAAIEPRAEFQQVRIMARETGNAGQGMRHDAHALALLPEHQNLRLGLDDGLGGKQVLAQLGHLCAVPAVAVPTGRAIRR